MAERGQWSAREAQEWYPFQPWLIGCNYIPSNAINQLEMWQAASFDEAANDRELSWAARLGFNTLRVYLHDLPWKHDADGFLGRIDLFLAISARYGIRPLFVLFDGVWDPYPVPGPQRAPRPRVHNSGWVQSPGAAILGNPSRHDEMEPYVKGVIGRFRDDERVLGWDLFKEPDNPNPAYREREISQKKERALELLRLAYQWAREVGPTQPITSGVWRPQWVQTGELSELDRLQLDESDVISFHLYAGVPVLKARLTELKRYGRPILLTEYLARPFGSTFEAVLPILKEVGVGAYCWGLVSGKTQTIYGWDSWARQYEGEPEVWFHDILRPDGTPYDGQEADFIRRLAER